MEKYTVKEYARRHKMSIFQVIRKINRGELKAESVEENGIKTQYVLLDTPLSPPESDGEKEGPAVRSKENSLEEEVTLLRREVERLAEIVESCCRKISDKNP